MRRRPNNDDSGLPRLLWLLGLICFCLAGIFWFRSDDRHQLDVISTQIDRSGALALLPGTFETYQPSESREPDSRPADPPSGFGDIEDKTRRFPWEAALRFRQKAIGEQPGAFEKRARRDLSFAHFALDPALYRGERVFLKGHIRRLLKYPVPKRMPEWGAYYEAWLFTAESQANPYIVILNEVPDAIPIGGDIQEEVSCAGYFLKLMAYEAADTNRFAPLIIGNRLIWHPRPERPQLTLQTTLIVLGVLGALLVGLVIAVVWSNRSVARARAVYNRGAGAAPDDLDQHAIEDPVDYLKRLEQESD